MSSSTSSAPSSSTTNTRATWSPRGAPGWFVVGSPAPATVFAPGEPRILLSTVAALGDLPWRATPMAPGEPIAGVAITGVMEQFDSTAPYLTGYRVRPRDAGDVVVGVPLISRPEFKIALVVGLVILFVSVAREKLHMRKSDAYKDVVR